MGVVYHANYLRFMERARTEFVTERLRNVAEYHDQGTFFMVHKIDIAFHSPAKLGDSLVIRTWIDKTTRYRVLVKQIIIRKGQSRDYLTTASITLVAVGADGKLLEIPDEFHSLVIV